MGSRAWTKPRPWIAEKPTARATCRLSAANPKGTPSIPLQANWRAPAQGQNCARAGPRLNIGSTPRRRPLADPLGQAERRNARSLRQSQYMIFIAWLAPIAGSRKFFKQASTIFIAVQFDEDGRPLRLKQLLGTAHDLDFSAFHVAFNEVRWRKAEREVIQGHGFDF